MVASIVAGLRFVRSNNALLGSFVIDLVAMTFGMPRALFAVLSLTVYHAGAGGAGLLYAAVAAGATVAGGVRLGDIEAGSVASLTSARTSVLSGGMACIVGAGLVVLAFPALVAYDGGERPEIDRRSGR